MSSVTDNDDEWATNTEEVDWDSYGQEDDWSVEVEILEKEVKTEIKEVAIIRAFTTLQKCIQENDSTLFQKILKIVDNPVLCEPPDDYQWLILLSQSENTSYYALFMDHLIQQKKTPIINNYFELKDRRLQFEIKKVDLKHSETKSTISSSVIKNDSTTTFEEEIDNDFMIAVDIEGSTSLTKEKRKHLKKQFQVAIKESQEDKFIELFELISKESSSLLYELLVHLNNKYDLYKLFKYPRIWEKVAKFYEQYSKVNKLKTPLISGELQYTMLLKNNDFFFCCNRYPITMGMFEDHTNLLKFLLNYLYKNRDTKSIEILKQLLKNNQLTFKDKIYNKLNKMGINFLESYCLDLLLSFYRHPNFELYKWVKKDNVFKKYTFYSKNFEKPYCLDYTFREIDDIKKKILLFELKPSIQIGRDIISYSRNGQLLTTPNLYITLENLKEFLQSCPDESVFCLDLNMLQLIIENITLSITISLSDDYLEYNDISFKHFKLMYKSSVFKFSEDNLKRIRNKLNTYIPKDIEEAWILADMNCLDKKESVELKNYLRNQIPLLLDLANIVIDYLI